jgi:hypothetical protein
MKYLVEILAVAHIRKWRGAIREKFENMCKLKIFM